MTLLKIILTAFITWIQIINSFGANAQDFSAAYRKSFIASNFNKRPISSVTLKDIDAECSRLSKTLNAFKKTHGYSILKNDTIFLIKLIIKDNNYTIVWNGKESCYNTIRSRTKLLKGGYTHSVAADFKVYTDASEVLSVFPQDCRQWILEADTNKFNKDASDKLNSSYVSFVKAVLKNKRWYFTKGASYKIDL